MTPERIARVCHEANRAYCAAIGDLSQVAWDDAPLWQKESAVAGVKFVMGNPHAGPSANHDDWLRIKRAEGWVYGPEKVPEAKVHPCMVPFESLPEEQQMKDILFRSVVLALTDV